MTQCLHKEVLVSFDREEKELTRKTGSFVKYSGYPHGGYPKVKSVYKPEAHDAGLSIITSPDSKLLFIADDMEAFRGHQQVHIILLKIELILAWQGALTDVFKEQKNFDFKVKKRKCIGKIVCFLPPKILIWFSADGPFAMTSMNSLNEV